MFPSFIGILDIQSWWEVPSIAYFCSLFRTAFNLLDFDIEELEEALLTDGTEESSSLLTELIVRLLNGCLGNNDISAFNYQMYLRRLFRRKCQETGRYNPFNTDIDFQFLPLRTKVEILYALCDFRLDAEDVFDLFKNLEAESLRVEPLGFDSADSAYWYFYGTRLYREDIIRTKGKAKKKRNKEKSKRGWFYGEDWLDDDETERVWQVVCFTEEDWAHLTEKFSKATSKVEKELHRSLKQNFLPEIPRLFQEKERLQRKRLLELAPRRTSSRVLQKIKQKEEEDKQSAHDSADPEDSKETPDLARENRAKRRNQLRRAKSTSSESSEHSQSEKEEMPQKVAKRAKSQDKRSKNCSATHKGEPPPDLPIKTGRKTNNSLASATGQILIPDNDEPVSSTRKKLKTSQIFSQTEEDIQTDMYKVLEQLTAHEDAWPFMDPVEEEYAPNYYAVIRRPMDLRKMEERLDSGFYTDFSMFKADFKLIVNNCRLYNGQDNEYTTMVDKLQAAFDRLTEKYLHGVTSSDDEIAVEYQIPTPSRKHKRKSSESPGRHRRKKRKSHSDTGEPQSSTSDQVQENPESELKVHKKSKESHKSKTSKKDGKKDGKKEGKKKRKGHHRHGKHSKNHKKESQKSGHSKHNKKQKHSKHKDKDGKKSKQKKKKSKHQEPEIEESEIKRSTSMESIESSNRSRSASPLPSIHTPSPTPSPEPTEQEQLDQLNDPDFFKDKYDKIKERRRNAAKDAWESLFDYKQKTVDKQKQNLNIPEKDKNQKLRETIEKLKAKNEKYKESSLFNSLFSAGQSGDSKSRPASTTKEISSREDDNPDLFNDELEDSSKGKVVSKKGPKKSAGKNESASEALEQAVKDISKWLDDAPKGSAGNSPCDSPAQTISTEDNDNSRLDDELSVGEKTQAKKDVTRKRPSSREPKLVKRREIQRTIERLQPGKSKGNLLTNMSSKNLEKSDESSNSGIQNKIRDSNKQEEVSPKLSLGSVLATVEFTLGKDHNFANNDDNKTAETKEISEVTETAKESQAETVISDKKTVETPVPSTKKDAEVETEPQPTMKPSQEKATPNLSAWFKAFGAPKSTVTTANVVVKKKTDEAEPDEKVVENPNNEKVVTDKNVATKTEPAVEPETPNPEGGDSPLPGASVTPRQRRTSTGSSVSERSSFSQDLDSPRHQMSHTSPLLRSPASPRTDDFQKITYPIINGTVRAGFYQDTTSIKSSPEKSCSPRDGPQSPYSPYSQHVYASNNAMGSATPNYFVDHNKSPLPTYSQNPPPYYDASKVPLINKPGRAHDDYTSLGPDSYQQNPYSAPLSPLGTPYPLTPSANYSQVQDSPQPVPTSPPTAAQPADRQAESKSALFPVKKRSYSEPESPAVSIKKVADAKDITVTPINRSDYQKPNQPINQISSTPSVDDIALALTEKSELAKLNSLREKVANISAAYAATEAKDNTYEKNDGTNILDRKDIGNVNHNQPIGMIKKDNVDIVNMGYMRLDNERRNVETHEHEFTPRDVSKTNLHTNLKGYEVEAIAMNLGLNNQQMQKASMKSNSSNIPPAHAHIQERPQSDLSNMNPTIAHSHHNQFDAAQHSTALTMSNISLNDIELANKKLYSCNSTTTTSAIDYGNWKMTNQMRKQDMIPSDYSTSYGANPSDKTKPTNNSTMNTAPVNYNKTIQQQHQQYNTFNNIPRSSLQRTQELQQNLSAELRIPNPRGHLKNDSINITSSISSSEYTNKNVDSLAKNQKTQDKHVQNHPLSSPMAYKTPYSTHSGHPLETLRNLPNIPQMLERYTNDERYLSSFAGSGSLYHDKSFQMAQMFNKTMASEVHSAAASTSIYSQPATSKDIYKANAAPTPQVDTKAKAKRKRTTDTTKQAQLAASQSYHNAPCTDVLSTVKSSMMSGAFNFGTSTNMALGGGLYGDNAGFSMEDFRNSTSQLMAANYMAAAVAHQQRGADGADKLAKPAHQGGAFPFMAHGQRAGYGFAESSPLYQQYLQRHQEELLRSGAQIMGLYPPAYPAPLAARQPYDAVNRRSWL